MLIRRTIISQYAFPHIYIRQLFANYGEIIIFASLTLMSLVPIWLCTYIPTLDGPLHLANAKILESLLLHNDALFSQYFMIMRGSYTNYAEPLLLIALYRFSSILVAEKILLSLYIILLPLSARYAIASINSTNMFLSLLMFPFVYNCTFNYGFYGFVLSLPFFFIAIGFWYQHRASLSTISVIILATIILLSYLFHPLTFIMIGIVLFSATAYQLFDKLNHAENKLCVLRLFLVKHIVPLVYSLLPSILLLLYFFKQEGRSVGFESSFYYRLLYRLVWLITLGTLRSLGRLDYITAISLAGIFIWLIIISIKGKKVFLIKNEFVISLFALLFVYFCSPSQASNGSVIIPRLQLFVIFILILCFAEQSFSSVLKRNVLISACLICLFSTSHILYEYRHLNKYLETYLSTSRFIKTDSTVLSINFQKRPQYLQFSPWHHAASHLSWQRHIVDLIDSQATETYFPVNYNPRLNPFTHLGHNIQYFPYDINIKTYMETTNSRVDYVLLWGDYDTFIDNEHVQLILSQLNDLYTLIYEDKSFFPVQLFRLK